jgi:DNA polymerase-3 subunit chi
MSQVTFHVNAPDPMAYACRLLRKAAGQGARVVVTGESDTLDRLDLALWTFAAQEFLPHCRSDAGPAMLQASSVVLAEVDQHLPQAPVLLHLGGPAPAASGDFAKIIEIVGQGESDRLDARLRWKQYAALGHQMAHHDVAQAGRAHE